MRFYVSNECSVTAYDDPGFIGRGTHVIEKELAKLSVIHNGCFSCDTVFPRFLYTSLTTEGFASPGKREFRGSLS